MRVRLPEPDHRPMHCSAWQGVIDHDIGNPRRRVDKITDTLLEGLADQLAWSSSVRRKESS